MRLFVDGLPTQTDHPTSPKEDGGPFTTNLLAIFLVYLGIIIKNGHLRIFPRTKIELRGVFYRIDLCLHQS